MRIGLTSTTYARTSLAISPLADLALSVRELAGFQSSPALRQWRHQALRAVQDIDLTPVRALFKPVDFAEVLSPPPTQSTADLGSQLDALVNVPAECLRRDIRRLYGTSTPAAAREYVRTPAAALDRLATTLEKYWAAVLAPWWPRLSAVLEQDLLFRAQTLTHSALPAMVNGIHPHLRASEHVLDVGPHRAPDRVLDRPDIVAGVDGLVFVASVFVTGKPMINVEDWQRTAIFYAARGVGHLNGRANGRRPVDALSTLLSHRRAELVRAVRTPSTPGELARLLGVTSSAVSQQLAQLTAAGLVRRNQLGRKAFYQLTADGRALLDILDRTG
jgi:DNA-binding transcriptional ArsR family regulator